VQATTPDPLDIPTDWPLLPSGLQPGDSFRLLFVSSNQRNGSSSDIGVYNSHVQANANSGHAAIRSFGDQFRALASTRHATQAVNAKTNTGTGSGTGEPIYWLNGAKAADNYADFYDGSWDSTAPRNQRGEAVTGVVFVWTGSGTDGTEFVEGGTNRRGLGSTTPAVGRLASTGTVQPLQALTQPASTASRVYGLSPALTVTVDYDTDDDNLIEVSNLEQLNAVRWDLDGNGISSNSGHAAAFPNAPTGMGCAAAVCQGYELAADLDFDDAGSYASGSVNMAWTSGTGWTPIPNFNTLFEGNGHTISNLFINRASSDRVGLFATVESGGEVRNAVLDAVDVTGRDNVGALVGVSPGTVANVSATGSVTGRDNVGALVGVLQSGGAITGGHSAVDVTGSGTRVGGLVGQNQGSITASYATGTVDKTGTGPGTGGLVGDNAGAVSRSYATGAVTSAGRNVGGLAGEIRGSVTASYATGRVEITNTSHSTLGGLVGWATGNGRISASYSTGEVTGGGGNRGGLVGDAGNSTTITDSYWDTDTSINTSAAGTGKTTSELQSPTGYTGIYAAWNVDADGDAGTGDASGNDNPWDFGTASQYPALKVDFDGDGVATAFEFGVQGRTLPPPLAPTGLTATVVSTTQVDLTWTAPPAGGGRDAVTGYLVEAEFVGAGTGWFEIGSNITATQYTNTLLLAPAVDSQMRYRVSAKSNSGNSDPSNVVTAVPNPSSRDYDSDDDNLIEIASLEQLNAMRWDLDGNGAPATANASDYAAAFPNSVTGMGCAAACAGYELAADLDFDDASSYASGSVNTAWTSGTGWEPIVNFNTLFEG
ncbi:MAG: hypothetical protein OXP08_13190, partial [bacterium]|nr:hypothetical protein [bacterium]